jgi:hypothetical protein
VRGHFEWQAVNKSVYRDINGIENVFADLYSIKYNTDWLTLLPVNSNYKYSVSAGDTIDIYLQLLEFQGGKVDSFCNSLMKVDIAISDSYNNIRYLTVDSLKLVCVE